MTSSNNEFFFSIVVPTYNRAHLICKTIDSILSQTYTNYEVIIVDDGSTDNTENVIQTTYSAEDKVSYYKKENAERAAARNFGTQKAKGKYVLWFDSDDIMYLNHLETALKIISKNNIPEIVALSHHSRHFNNKIYFTGILPKEINGKLYKGNILSCNAVFVRKDITELNTFNEDRGLSASEDYELWMRLSCQYKFHTSQEITSAIIAHNERSVTSMADANKLIQRFERFLHYTTLNSQIMDFLGDKASYFVMKNYLILAADLAVNKHKKEARKYLKLAIQTNKKAFLNRTFYASVKHLIF